MFLFSSPDRDYWYSQAKGHIEDILTARRASNGYAKNVILFVGDGMGVSTVTAGRILKGQREGYSGEEYRLSFEKFPYVALAKVSLTFVPDSRRPGGLALSFAKGKGN